MAAKDLAESKLMKSWLICTCLKLGSGVISAPLRHVNYFSNYCDATSTIFDCTYSSLFD
jgi:hypothetical protein